MREKFYIDVDEMYPVFVITPVKGDRVLTSKVFSVDKKLVDEYKETYSAFMAVQDKLKKKYYRGTNEKQHL